MERELEQLEGTVEDIIYQNEDNGYTVFEVSGGGVVTVVCGVVGELHAGRASSAGGGTRTTPPMGGSSTHRSARPICPKTSRPSMPSSPAGRCPTSAHGRRTRSSTSSARRRWRSSPTTPPSSPLIPGISADKADRIQQEFKRMFGMRELIAYLAQFEISPRRAMEVFRTFGPGAMTAIQQNPYLLCGEPLQLDFRHADSIAQYYQMAGGLRPAAGSRPPAHPPPQRGQRPHLPAPRPAAGYGLELHPPAPEKLDEALARCLGAETLAEKRPSTARNISTCPTFWPPSRTSPTVWPC